VDELLKGHDFEVPESLLERQIDVRLERGLRALAAQGMRTEDMKRMDFPRLRAGQREAAVREVKTSLLLDRIADKESVEVRDDEIEKEVQAIAEQSRQGVDAVRSRLAGEGALERMRGRMRNEKTLDMLYARASQQV
jgi:trigger factor